jgi:hypothetical protein
MNTKPIDPSTGPAKQTPTRKTMKQFSQTDAESGRDTQEIEHAAPRRKDGREGSRAEPPTQLDPGSSPYEEPDSEQRDR